MKLVLVLLLAFSLPLEALEISLEQARTKKQIAWGLMGRSSLPPNHGMAFTMPKKSKISVWMFNCYMDLSVAFLDDERKIIEMRDLIAYPEMMDPRRPVFSVEDFSLYPAGDPIREFFQKHAVKSTYPAKYFIEMPKGWFADNGVEIGDQIVWYPGSSKGRVLKAALVQALR